MPYNIEYQWNKLHCKFLRDGDTLGSALKFNLEMFFGLSFSEIYQSYPEQVYGNCYLWVFFYFLPGLFHAPAPIDVVKDQ